VDLEKSWKVEAGALKSKSKNTPYDGMELPAVMEKTFHNGVLVYDRAQQGQEGA
jgi:dihydroorotase-like cyclic amidohydrolase